MATTITQHDFLADRQGAKYADLQQQVNLDDWMAFFSDPDRQRRMMEAEIHYDYPALAGVIKELERHPAFESYLSGNDAHVTLRGRQAIGVIVRMVMEGLGWRKTGRKGSLGQRAPVSTRTTAPGAYHNVPGSLSRWFTRAEHYELPNGMPYSDNGES